eukprot:12981969-Heterocapsa_arctica.AAC.1
MLYVALALVEFTSPTRSTPTSPSRTRWSPPLARTNDGFVQFALGPGCGPLHMTTLTTTARTPSTTLTTLTTTARTPSRTFPS